MKGKALRRALAADPTRVNAEVPLIEDRTELISPEQAQEMLQKNRHNRPVNWNKVEEYSKVMEKGDWKLHPQGIILDPDGNIITGQTRLWAVVYSGRCVYFRVSRGTPKETATVIDRGRPQSARDLATRITERKHSPHEASLARAICVLSGNMKPSTDDIAKAISEKSMVLKELLRESHRIKKTKAVMMILAVIAWSTENTSDLHKRTKKIDYLAIALEKELQPVSAEKCWGRGTAFSMALETAKRLVYA